MQSQFLATNLSASHCSDSFFFFLLVLLVLTLALVVFTHAIAVWSPSPVTAGIILSTSISFMALTDGFFLCGAHDCSSD